MYGILAMQKVIEIMYITTTLNVIIVFPKVYIDIR